MPTIDEPTVQRRRRRADMDGEPEAGCPTPPAPTETPYVAVVRRGHDDLFRTMQDHFDRPGFARTLWDRRTAQRRSSWVMIAPDRRAQDRRGPLPDTWATLGFVFSPRGGPRR